MRLEVDYDSVRVIDILPSEGGRQIAIVLKHKGSLLMFGLWVDVFSNSCIDSSKIHNATIKTYFWTLHI